jgi:hypothetical protein
VRTEGILTQLIFEHALRIRVKAETESSGPSRGGSSVHTPDSTSVIEGHEVSLENSDGETVLASANSIKSNASTDNKGKQTFKEGVKEPVGARNLIGKINNLVSTDLGNITEARDFMFVCELAVVAVSIFLC